MKNLMGKLKSLKFKDFLLDHVEKLVFGGAILTVLLVLSSSQWTRYEKTPQQIQDKVKTARNAIQASVWPQEKRAQFALRDFAGDAQRVRGPLAVAAYEYSTNMWWPLYRKQELAKEPEMLAVIDLRADAGRIAMAVNLQQPLNPALATTNQPAAAPAPAVNDNFAPVRGVPGGKGGTGMTGEVAANPYPFGAPPAGPMAAEAYVGSEGMGGPGSSVEPRGERFISVRGVWPLWQQMEKFQRALNLQTTNDARNFLEIVDFVLERQEAVAGDDPWAGPWDVVDIQRAKDVLDEAEDYDIDVLDPQILDPVITMPLPARVVGIWGKYATHPRIEKFTLPPAELEREMKLQEKLMEQYEKYRLQSQPKARGGFASRTLQVRTMANDMYGSEYAGDFDQTMKSVMDRDPTLRMQLPDLKSRLTAVGRLLLFRYMDFDVRPGYAYRYRVKLMLNNPNYNRPVDQVLEPSVAEGEFRETPWSNASNPAVVQESVDYFLVDVERDPALESRPNASRPLAKFDFFEWDAGVGTMIRDTIELKSIGQFISETKKSLRLDVVTPSFKDTEVAFRSDDVLLDAKSDVVVDAKLHPDLQLVPTLRGKLGIIPEAVVVDEAGQLVALNRMSNQSRYKELDTYVRSERAPFEPIKNAAAKPQGAMFGGDVPGVYDAANPYAAEGGQGPADESWKKSRRSRKPPQGMNAEGMMGAP